VPGSAALVQDLALAQELALAQYLAQVQYLEWEQPRWVVVWAKARPKEDESAKIRRLSRPCNRLIGRFHDLLGATLERPPDM
jgi:hypothetical protein